MSNLEAARAQLRARQGDGARYDAASAPAVELTWARRGTAYFGRLLNNLTSSELEGPSLVPGWSRAHVVAHVSYNARAIARVAEGLRTGQETALYPSLDEREAEIALASTLPERALRHLFEHTVVHLNVEWRDLSDADWTASCTGLAGATLPVADTPWIRAREVWLHALDLDAGGRVQDLPVEFLERLAAEAPDVARQPAGRRPLNAAGPSNLPEDWPY